jgi:hypothetical protein
METTELTELDFEREQQKGKISRVVFQGPAGDTVDVDLTSYTLGISRDGREIYYIDLERCTSSAKTLDWIMQITQKTWATQPLLGLIVKVLNIALHPQATLCSFGSNRTLEPANIRRLVKGRMREAITWKDSYAKEGIAIIWK